MAEYLVENKFFYNTKDTLELISFLERDNIITEVKKGFYKFVKVKEIEGNISYNKNEKRKIFNVFEHTLSEILEYEQEHSKKQINVPFILYHLTEQVIKRGGYETQGIFRVSTSQKKLEFYAQKFAEHQSYSLEISDDAHVPANLLKHFLRCIPEPAIPDYSKAMIFANQAPTPQVMDDFLDSLPITNQNVIKFLSQFISTFSGHEERTKMNFDSLAILFTPILLVNPTTNVLALVVSQQIEIAFIKNLFNYINNRSN